MTDMIVLCTAWPGGISALMWSVACRQTINTETMMWATLAFSGLSWGLWTSLPPLWFWVQCMRSGLVWFLCTFPYNNAITGPESARCCSHRAGSGPVVVCCGILHDNWEIYCYDHSCPARISPILILAQLWILCIVDIVYCFNSSMSWSQLWESHIMMKPHKILHYWPLCAL